MIAQIVFFGSMAGMVFILARKMLYLDRLQEKQNGKKPESLQETVEKENVKTKNSSLFLQKLLSRIKILSQKAENKADSLLQELRQNQQKERIKDNSYWQKIKDVKKIATEAAIQEKKKITKRKPRKKKNAEVAQ